MNQYYNTILKDFQVDFWRCNKAYYYIFRNLPGLDGGHGPKKSNFGPADLRSRPIFWGT